ncbi:rRNA small subunit methyltransferase B [Microbacterium sp. EYE_5]|uniref:RsmB/NOP family class I SAM-dependent RNA methyltransferase n=1 Tax=unclassified Microbacterium TaxID=2609290 RepID=UPI0020029AB5|nr:MULTISPECIES: transcription antitermination factor NusB [unclassified Microbacterium]MCK6080749.1 rRNA small subunit methyltransferase B [Microbacterium sp. EYE_382]MCK6086020.1 rRNA small subunit methyltransferase B [Microbacterium sp. EYE_384]MCK6124482.1 rRNA small subunit methyltransferase B [Microbacterium sp. EYE_80]MCK6127391.1 rRNA small subunit methyltransferase B [Microbacterium sp. EYE_79]MCK6141704.1 rRNA small subunit methyltransferase B [Microbacterium sp. EYE_39]
MTTSREVAYTVLRAVHEDDAYANLLLPRELARTRLGQADAALATELTYGTLRRLGTYDAIIAVAASRDVDGIDPAVLDALRLGTHQLLATRVPAHAAVHESVDLVRRAVGARATGFANAVLRRVSERDEDAWLSTIEAAARSDDERLAVRFAHPVWVIRALRRALGAEGRADELLDLLAADNAAPTVTMAALPGVGEPPVDAVRTPQSPIGFRLAGGDPEALIRGSGGALRVQDEGSQLAALALTRAVPVRAGERWLDLCAAPGGKTAVLAAEAATAGASVEANEISAARARLVRRSVAAVPIDVPVSEEDGRTRAGRSSYDRILVDAPCTGLGALRRRPEARWRKTAADVPQLSLLQAELLDAAVGALAPGGIVAYVTCSPHLAETAGVVAEIERRHEGRIEQLDARAVVASISRTPIDLPPQADGSGRAQLWPHRHGTDAMSISLLRRV